MRGPDKEVKEVAFFFQPKINKTNVFGDAFLDNTFLYLPCPRWIWWRNAAWGVPWVPSHVPQRCDPRVYANLAAFMVFVYKPSLDSTIETASTGHPCSIKWTGVIRTLTTGSTVVPRALFCFRTNTSAAKLGSFVTDEEKTQRSRCPMNDLAFLYKTIPIMSTGTAPV